MTATRIIGDVGSYVAEVSSRKGLLTERSGFDSVVDNVTKIMSGGVRQIVSNSLASPTVVTTTSAHGLVTGDKIFWTASTTSNPLLTATPQTTITRISDTTFSLDGINCSTGGTAGAYDYAIVSTPLTPGAAPLVNVGRAHGLRVGDTVTITASGSTPSLDGTQTVTAIDSPTAFRVLTSANPTTVAGSTTTGHYSKTVYNSTVVDRGYLSGPGAVVLTSVIGTAPNTSLVDFQGSADGTVWFNIPYALVATPTTFVVTQITVTTAVATTYLLQTGHPYRYVRARYTSNTNIDFTLNWHLLSA